MAEKNVRIRLFKDNSRYKGDLFVSVNGVNYKIRRGVEVEVPPEVAEVLEPRVDEIAEMIKECIDESGMKLGDWSNIYLTGGGSLLYGMDQMIASELGIPVLLSKEPTDCAALGLGNIIENYDLLQHLGRTSFLHEF